MIDRARSQLWTIWLGINRWLVGLQQHRIPQLLVLVCGLINSALAILFLWFPERIDSTPAIRYLATALSTDWWVIIFGAVGVAQCTVAIVRYTSGVLPCLLSSLAMLAFCILSSVNFVWGPAAGIVTVLSLGIGTINLIAAAGAVAPIVASETEEYLSRHGSDGS